MAPSGSFRARPAVEAAPAAAEASSQERQLLLATLPASRAQKRLALAVVLVLLVAFCVTALFSTAPIGYLGEFIPAYATAMFVISIITSALLFVQFSIVRSRALLAISSGYLFTALITIPWALTFPDLYGESGQRSTVWVLLSTLWHAGFPVFVIGYALMKDDDGPTRLPRRSLSLAVLSSVAAVIVLAAVLTLLAKIADELLPNFFPSSIDFAISDRPRTYLNGLALFLTFFALALLWSRWRSMLDLWLMVMMCAWLIEVSLIFLVGRRYVAGWYAARVYGLASATFVLGILLSETAWLYAQLARSVLAERREREARLMSMDALSASIAHEMNQPLASLVTSADAALRWLGRPTPDLDEVKSALEQIRKSGHHASHIIGSVRAMIKKDARNRAPVDVNELVREALALLESELRRQRISVEIELNGHLPMVNADRVQLQQVLMNLITNAIDAMSATKPPRILRIKSAAPEPDSVLVSVEDTGSGIDPMVVSRIFDPLFTTKSRGMGMGLSICRSIIEGHGGRLSVSAGAKCGSVFQFVLPAE